MHLLSMHSETDLPLICIYIQSAESIWFEIWGVADPGKRKFDFYRQIPEKFRFLQAISLKKSDFSTANFRKILIFQEILKKFEFPGKNWSFTTTSWQIILFLFKNNHFRTYFLYMIRYNNISRPVHHPNDPPATPPATPHDPSAQNMEVATLNPQD